MYVCVPFEYLPFVSKKVILTLNTILKSKNKIKYISIDKWYDIFSPSKDKNLLINFLDIIPELIWTKDENNKYTYANQAVCKKLLLKDRSDIIGKTSLEISNEHEKDGMVFTFGELCADSDKITKERNKMSLFYEYGLINDKFISLRVLKCPIYDSQNNIVGIMGAARDISFHTLAHEKIEKLIMKGEIQKAMSEFVLYKSKFDSFREYKDLDSFIEEIEYTNGRTKENDI